MNKVQYCLIRFDNLTLEEILEKYPLRKEDLLSLENYKSEKTKKEKTISLFLKRTYVGGFYINKYGKPETKGFYFNVSHSGDAVIFVKADVPVGVDIEKRREHSKLLQEHISSLEEINEDFFKVWTAKESLTKCIGTGVIESMKNIPSLPFDGVKTYKENTYFSHIYEIDNYVISIVIQSNNDFKIVKL